MDKRQKAGLAIIILGLLAIGAIVYFIFLQSGDKVSQPAEEQPVSSDVKLPAPTDSDITPSDKPRNYAQYDISKEAPHETGAADVAKLASAFAERLGSYSNQSDYANFDDLSIFMTASMRDWASAYVSKMRSENPYSGGYYGITTKAIAAQTEEFDASSGKAKVLITTQRRESKQGGENVFNQDLRLDMAEQNGQWLVDGAYWLK